MAQDGPFSACQFKKQRKNEECWMGWDGMGWDGMGGVS